MISIVLLVYLFTIIESKNVLLLIADDAGLETPVYGNEYIKTPNLDRLAKKSVVFESAFTAVSSCSPSRASILTGLPPHQNGMYGLHHGYHHFNCFDKVKSISKILKHRGIRTGIIGKKHVGPKTVFPFDYEETEENNSMLQVGRNITKIKELVATFLSINNSAPFFLYVAFHDPHRCGHTHPQFGEFCEKFGNGEKNMGTIPDWKPEEYSTDEVKVPFFVQNTSIARKDLAAQYTTISRLDRGIGLVLEELRKAGRLNDTLVIYSSDNGIPFPSGRTNAYEPGMVEPFFVSSPLHKEFHGKRTSQLASLLDIAPTILDWFDIKYPSYRIIPNTKKVKLTGKSLLPFLNPEVQKNRKIYFSHNLHEVTMYYPIRSVRSKHYKLIHNLNYRMPFPIDQDFYISRTFQEILNSSISHKYIPWYKTLKNYYYRSEWELYDLRYDKEERKNLINTPSYNLIYQKLLNSLKKWQNRTSDPWLCNPHSVLQDSGKFKKHHKCLPLFND